MQIHKYTNTKTQVQRHKCKHTNTNTQIHSHKYKHTNTNTQINIHRYKSTNAKNRHPTNTYQLSLKKIVVDFINVYQAILNAEVHEKYCKIAKLP